jgi:hypothetical protein
MSFNLASHNNSTFVAVDAMSKVNDLDSQTNSLIVSINHSVLDSRDGIVSVRFQKNIQINSIKS